MIRPLIIDESLKRAANKIVKYAAENHYVALLDKPPGDNPKHVLTTFFGYRCVFSFTEHPDHPGELYRDLSVSVTTPGKYPNEFAFYTVATELFGFTGWDGATIIPPPKGWLMDKDIHHPAIRLVQREPVETKP